MSFNAANDAMVVLAPDMSVSPELRLRIVSAAILAPLTLAVLWAGDLFLLAGLLVAVYLLAREWAALVTTPGGALGVAAPAAIAVVLAYAQPSQMPMHGWPDQVNAVQFPSSWTGDTAGHQARRREPADADRPGIKRPRATTVAGPAVPTRRSNCSLAIVLRSR